jgi:hypothetical protein
VRMDHVHRLRNPTSLAVAVTASMLAALLSRDLHAALERATEMPTGSSSPSGTARGAPPCGEALE